jgi:hypothetical protein
MTSPRLTPTRYSIRVLLDDDAASNGRNGTIENGNEAIARRIHQTSMMLDDAGLDEIALDPLEADMRALLVGLHRRLARSTPKSIACKVRAITSLARNKQSTIGSELLAKRRRSGSNRKCRWAL